MGLSDLPDTYIHPISKAVRPEIVGVHIKQIMREYDTTDMHHANTG